MKFVCLGYFDEKQWATMSETEQKNLMEECFAYDDVLRKGGHFAGGEALQPATAATLRSKNGKVVVTDGPYAETKEQIGGILILEAKDQNQATELMSRHPGMRVSIFEIRATDEAMNALVEERNQRTKRQ